MQIKIAHIKFITNAIVGIGTNAIMRDIIANNTNEPQSRTDKVTHSAGSAVLSGMVVTQTASYTDKLIDDVVKGWTQGKTRSTES